jgi:hypothetical protein
MICCYMTILALAASSGSEVVAAGHRRILYARGSSANRRRR